MLDGVLQGVASVVNLGDPNPQQVSQKCGYTESCCALYWPCDRYCGRLWHLWPHDRCEYWWLGGNSTALPFLEAQAADIVAGNVFKGISDVDSVDAIVVGSVALFGNIAKARGMKPLSAAEGMKYAAASQESRNRYTSNTAVHCPCDTA